MKRTSTSCALAGSRDGWKVNFTRDGGSHSSTWPHWNRRPSVCSSKIRPPTRGSNTTRRTRFPPIE
jgi:hypothetical protein